LREGAAGCFSIGFFRRHRNQFRRRKFMFGWGDD
jgi:hypothetical protein